MKHVHIYAAVGLSSITDLSGRTTMTALRGLEIPTVEDQLRFLKSVKIAQYAWFSLFLAVAAFAGLGMYHSGNLWAAAPLIAIQVLGLTAWILVDHKNKKQATTERSHVRN